MKKHWKLMMVFILTFAYVDSVSAVEKPELKLASKAAVLVDSKTGKVLFEKNANQKLYPASLTKIATAIYAIENGNLDDVVTISKNVEQTDGTKVYLVEGEQVTLKHLIQGLLINSGNDAGVAIAEYMSGSVAGFANDLNHFLVTKIGVSATHFVNPHGLFDSEHLTTANDLAKITNYAIKNETFRKIFGTRELKWDGQSWDTTLITHHLILKGEIDYKGVTGGKTGYVNESGQTLATTGENQNIHLTVITLNAKSKKDAYADTIKLLDYGFQHFETSILPKDTTFNIGQNVYTTKKNLYFTKPIRATVSEKILNGGMLNIVDKKGFVLDSFQLSAKRVGAASQTSTVKTNSNTHQQTPWSLYMLFLFLGAGIVFAIKKVLVRK